MAVSHALLPLWRLNCRLQEPICTNNGMKIQAFWVHQKAYGNTSVMCSTCRWIALKALWRVGDEWAGLTRACSNRLLAMTMQWTSCCHTMRQKSPIVCRLGPASQHTHSTQWRTSLIKQVNRACFNTWNSTFPDYITIQYTQYIL